MMKRLAVALAVVVVLAVASAFAQNNFPTPGGATANGVQNMCLNASNQSVACSATNPVPIGTAPYPSGATPVQNSTGNVAAAVATATLGAQVGKTTYICGFKFTSSGATAASVVTPTIVGTTGTNMSFTLAVVAGVTLGNADLHQEFAPCIPASAANTNIVVSAPSLGAGNTNATMAAWGYQQ